MQYILRYSLNLANFVVHLLISLAVAAEERPPSYDISNGWLPLFGWPATDLPTLPTSGFPPQPLLSQTKPGAETFSNQDDDAFPKSSCRYDETAIDKFEQSLAETSPPPPQEMFRRMFQFLVHRQVHQSSRDQPVIVEGAYMYFLEGQNNRPRSEAAPTAKLPPETSTMAESNIDAPKTQYQVPKGVGIVPLSKASVSTVSFKATPSALRNIRPLKLNFVTTSTAKTPAINTTPLLLNLDHGSDVKHLQMPERLNLEIYSSSGESRSNSPSSNTRPSVMLPDRGADQVTSAPTRSPNPMNMQFWNKRNVSSFVPLQPLRNIVTIASPSFLTSSAFYNYDFANGSVEEIPIVSE